MKSIFFSLTLAASGFCVNSIAQAASCTSSTRTGTQVCVGDQVGYKYNEAIGTVVAVYRKGYADVSWNIVGSGFGRQLPLEVLTGTTVVSEPHGSHGRNVVDAQGNRLHRGAIVSYNYNEAIGTVDAVYKDSQTVDVNWNIVGSGYGKNLPATDVTLR